MFSDAEIAVFLDELEEKIQVLDDNILILEQEGDNMEVLQEIFRAAHTIKGSSAVMGYDKMASLTHEMENIFDRLRRGDLHVSLALIDTLFDALDALKELKQEITGGSDGDDSNVDLEPLLAELRRFAESTAGDDFKGAEMQAAAGDEGAKGVAALGEGEEETAAGDEGEEETAAGDEGEEETAVESEGEETAAGGWVELTDVDENVICEARRRGFRAYRIKVVVEPGCQMKSVRAFLIFKILEKTGEIIKCAPAAEDLQEGRYENEFQLVYLTRQDMEKIKRRLLNVAEIEDVKVVSVEEEIDGGDIDRGVKNAGRAEDGAAKNTDLTGTAASGDAGKDTATKSSTAQGDLRSSGVGRADKSTGKGGRNGRGKRGSQTVRVDVRKLDNLLNLVGELVIDRTRLDRFVELFEGRSGSDELLDSIKEISAHLGQVSGDLQEEIMQARMLPVAQVFNRFPRMVRDLSQKLGKEIDFIMEGKETELDRNVIEIITDPLIHLIRNAVDHGIERPEERLRMGKPRRGTLKLKASYQESHILITVEDDGKGMDPNHLKKLGVEKGIVDAAAAERMTEREALDLIFLPGFSSAGSVSDLSGRGVGMDIVRNQIEQINGSVEMDTRPGVRTRFTIKLPLTLVIIRALMVSLAERVYAIPLSNVVETIRVDRSEVKKVRNSEVILVRGQVLPVVWLADVFGHEVKRAQKLFIVILGAGEKKLGVIVDELLGEQEIVIKSLGEYLGHINILSGATILGDGRVALIIDVRGLIKEVGVEDIAYEAS